MGIQPGYGHRHPSLEHLLESSPPAAQDHASWGTNGKMPLAVAAHLGSADLPDELITSIRCIVGVGDRIVVCETPNGAHPWPGGRRQPGESHWQTARREVHEETGWLIEAEPFETVGWIHLRHLRDQAEDWPYPHPDFLQLVYTAETRERDGGADNNWSDVEGWETSSQLMTLAEARERVSSDLLAHVFLEDLILSRSASRPYRD